MKEKILAAIKAKYPAINLSKKRLEQISNVIEAGVIDDETKIDAELNLYNKYNPLSDMASSDDKLRTAEKKLKETTSASKEDPKKETETPETETPAADAMPVWMKPFMDKLTKLEADKAQTTIQSQLKEKLKDVNSLVGWSEWKQPETDEEVTAFVEKVTAKSKELDKTLTEKGLSALAAPKSGTQADTSKTAAATAAIKASLEKDKPAATQATTPAAANPFVINTPVGF